MDPRAQSLIAERQAQGVLEPQLLINRLVYDSLQPACADQLLPTTSTLAGSCAGSSAGSSVSSSCRTTGSGFSSRSNSTTGDEPCAAADRSQATAAEAAAARYAYAPGLQPWHLPQSAEDTTLVFESRFESGNLRRAVQVYEFEYDLILQPDINTKGHTQFYFFAVSNTRAGQAYRFNIINLQKDDSLYSMGMLPLLHSEQEMHSKGIGWVRRGSEVGYGPNGIKRGKQGTYHTLTFVVEFPCDDDVVHLAHCYPYTYTDLQNQLHMLLKDPSGFLLQRSTLATSLAGNAVDVLTITAGSDVGKPLSQRQGVVLSGRVHPGETNSSWMLKGALEQLLASTAEAARLRESFVFKVVPMLNPDGVIVGNYRCSLAGLDLNRVWQEPDSRLQPVIAAYKAMIRSFMDEREVVLMCDLHGHSRKYGIFLYGCERKPKDALPAGSGWPVPGSVGGLPGVPVRVQERLFPLMLSCNAPDLFSFKGCNFKVQKSKAGTGRVVGFRELGLVNAFTMEASFCGPATGRFARQHFNTSHLEDMGAVLMCTLLDYWAPAELSSAAELTAHLAGSSSTGPLSGMLDLGGAGDADDDTCTDSDDESSDDETAPGSAGKQGNIQAGLNCSSGQGEAAGDAAAGAANTAAAVAARSSVAHLSCQLMAMLKGGITGTDVAGSRASGPAAALAAPSTAAAANACSDAGLTALLASLTGSLAAGSAVGSSISKNSQGPGCQSSASSSSSGASAILGVAAAARAAEDLLNRLVAARAKLPPATAAAAAASGAASASASVMSGVGPSAAASWSAGVSPGPVSISAARGSARVGVAAAACAPSTGALPAPGGAVGAAGLDAVAGAGAAVCVAAAASGSLADPRMDAPACGAGPLNAEEALAAMPGLIDLLQQLVAQCEVLDSVASASPGPGCGKATKKKGRRHGMARYGNPEVLRAARAKADAGLAAALPELGRRLLGSDLTPLDADGAPDDDNDASGSPSSVAAAPVAAAELPSPSGARQIRSGRRANVAAGAKAGSNCVLDAERYMELLDKQKQHTGGVLATSSIDDPWEACRTRSVLAGAEVAGAVGGAQPVLPGVRAAVTPGAQGPFADGPAAAPGGSRRRSKSAHAWLQHSISQGMP